MSHYDTLGLPRDAGTDDIKQAYRRRSAQAHPDRGGDADEMAAINRAYEVLGDAERRAEYDRTSSDATAASLEQEARGALMQLFQAALDSSDTVLSDVHAMVAEHRRRLLLAKSEAETKRSRLVKRTGKIRVKKGENLVQMLIDQQIRQIGEALPRMERGLAVNAMAAEMLREYEQDEDAVVPIMPAQQQFFVAFDQAFRGGTGGW